MAPKQYPKPKFQEGEQVLCFYGPPLYEAKWGNVAIKDKYYITVARTKIGTYEFQKAKYSSSWTTICKNSENFKKIGTYAGGKMRGTDPGKKTAWSVIEKCFSENNK